MSEKPETREGVVLDIKTIIQAIKYYAIIGIGLGVLAVIILFQFGGDSGVGIVGGILSLVILSFAVLSGPIIAAFVGFATSGNALGDVRTRTINSGIANGIGFAVFGIIVAILLVAGLDIITGSGGGSSTASSGGSSPIGVNKLVTLIVLMIIPNSIVGGGITFFSASESPTRQINSEQAAVKQSVEQASSSIDINRRTLAGGLVSALFISGVGAVVSGIGSDLIDNLLDRSENLTTESSTTETNTPDRSAAAIQSRSISLGETIKSEISGEDDRVLGHESPGEPFSISVDQRQAIRIQMNSDDLDPLIFVMNESGDDVAEFYGSSDYVDGKTTIEAGIYTIWAAADKRTSSQVPTGQYSLLIDSVDNSERLLALGNSIESEINRGDGSDPVYRDLAEPLSITTQQRQVVEISMNSPDFNPYVIVTVEDSGAVAEIGDDGDNTDGFGNRYTTGTVTLNSRTYTIWAGSVDGSRTGSYTLSVSTTDESGGA